MNNTSLDCYSYQLYGGGPQRKTSFLLRLSILSSCINKGGKSFVIGKEWIHKYVSMISLWQTFVVLLRKEHSPSHAHVSGTWFVVLSRFNSIHKKMVKRDISFRLDHFTESLEISVTNQGAWCIYCLYRELCFRNSWSTFTWTKRCNDQIAQVQYWSQDGVGNNPFNCR